MKTWVFNQAMLDGALASYFSQQIERNFLSLDDVEKQKVAIHAFLNSDAAVEAKMLMKGSSGEAKR